MKSVINSASRAALLQEGFLPVGEAAERIGESEGVIRRAIAGGALQPREGRGTLVLVNDDLTEWYDRARHLIRARRASIIERFAEHQRRHRWRYVSGAMILDHYAAIPGGANSARDCIMAAVRDRELHRAGFRVAMLHPYRPCVSISADEAAAVINQTPEAIAELWMTVEAFNWLAINYQLPIPPKWSAPSNSNSTIEQSVKAARHPDDPVSPELRLIIRRAVREIGVLPRNAVKKYQCIRKQLAVMPEGATASDRTIRDFFRFEVCD